MKVVIQTFLLFCICVVNLSEAANILYVIPFSAKSHYIMLRPIGLELARRGHNVTVITVHREANPPPNYHQVMVDNNEIWDLLGKEKVNAFSTVNMPAENFHSEVLWPGGLAFTESVFNSKPVKEFAAKDQSFDLVISELFLQEATYMFAHKFKAPLVLVTTYGNSMKQNILMRNPLQITTVVFEFLTLKDPTSFLSRLRNIYFTVYEYFWWKYWYMGKQDQMARTHIPNLPEPIPSLVEIQKNASLVLINSHFSFDGPVAYLPNIVEIGGLHITQSNDKLPEDLQKLLDSSTQGVVYVNFGSNVRSSELPPEKRDAFVNAFRRLKHTVLWKWEDDSLENLPANVVIRKWLPQSLILAHPNIKVFLSHGGLLGTQEALYYGVPIIGMPIYTDQYNNLLQVQDRGFGKIVEYHDINEELLYKTLNEILSNTSFKNTAVEVSRQFKDRPASAMDTAMFWIEYVIRNKGAHYMKNPALQFSCFAYYMLDVVVFLVVLISVFIIWIVSGVKLVKMVLQRSEKVSKKKKRN